VTVPVLFHPRERWRAVGIEENPSYIYRLATPLRQPRHLDSSSHMEGLINRSSTAPERASLIPAIFSTPDVVEKVRGLDGEDAQTFVDAIDEVSLDSEGQDRPLRLLCFVNQALDSLDHATRVKCLRSLYCVCDNHVLLPKSLVIPVSYDRTGVPLVSSSVADVWKGTSHDREVAIKVPRITAVDRSEEIRSVGCRFCPSHVYSQID